MELSTAIRVVVAAFVALSMSRRGLRKRSLDRSGAAAAFAVGSISLGVGYRFGLVLIAFYFSGSKLTNVKSDVKLRLDANYKIGGQRSAQQVLACSLLATTLAVVYQWQFGSASDWHRVDLETAPWRSRLLCSYIGHYACCAADTWASELGVLSKSAPRLITTLRKVPPGTNGAVSLVGTAAAAAGGAFIGAVYFVLSLPFGSAQWQVIALGAIMGTVGSALDSLLGATLQLTRFDPDAKTICAEGEDATRTGTQHVSGSDVLTNAQVNAVSVVLTTALSALVMERLM
ncbi:hypothetical protein P43SY_000158 [Pythium insidiosum]|uniref:Transmembrane protein 19 n=1 Tax=Pythium insidiosum TaxID=114742 RepID=A0AAD5LG56_PYTIN|nr:hypothetical protein P43SY_000158 [Pythium insidiosum]